MNTEFISVSGRDLFQGIEGLPSAIVRAKGKAAQILSFGLLVRKDFDTGHVNKSRTSTCCGTLAAAQNIVSEIPIPESGKPERIFGENISDAIHTIKSFLAKKK